jgi:hypothetical protein
MVEGIATSMVPPLVPGAGANQADDSTSLTIGVMYVPKQWHQELNKDKEKSTDPPAVQVSGQITTTVRKDGSVQWQHSYVGQVSMFVDPDTHKPVTQPMVGIQETGAADIVKGLLQVQAFAQILTGATIQKDKPVEGQVQAWRVMPTVQVGAGVQAVYSVGGSKHLQLVAQGQLSGTNSGGTVTGDKSYAFGLQWQF